MDNCLWMLKAHAAVQFAKTQLIKSGGYEITLKNTGKQWDTPNGWVTLQWMAIKELENYGEHQLAKDAAD
jgi:alpha,alpha-trehalase